MQPFVAGGRGGVFYGCYISASDIAEPKFGNLTRSTLSSMSTTTNPIRSPFTPEVRPYVG